MNENEKARELVAKGWQAQLWPGTRYADGGVEYAGRLVSPTGRYQKGVHVTRPMEPGEADVNLGPTIRFTGPAQSSDWVGFLTAIQEASISEDILEAIDELNETQLEDVLGKFLVEQELVGKFLAFLAKWKSS